MTGSRVRTCVTTPILDTLHFSVNGPSRHTANRAESPVNDLVEAIETVRSAVASSATGDDPFVLNDSTIAISFAVTAEGSISIGVNGSLSRELTHSLNLVLVPA
jgi:hypothetical protein